MADDAGSSWSMTTEQKPPRGTGSELAPAAERGEHWWPVALAIVAVVGLHVVLPARYRVQHCRWPRAERARASVKAALRQEAADAIDELFGA
jgi:hypothetical protein